MELITDKNKEQFLSWAFKQPYYKTYSNQTMLDEFFNLPFEMQIGVFQSYYLEKHNLIIRIEFGINLKTDEFDGFDYEIQERSEDTIKTRYLGWCKEYNGAYLEAFKIADGLVNRL